MIQGSIMNPTEYKSLFIIPEDIVRHCAKQVEETLPNEGNNFKLCLDYGDQFRIAGLTPVYLCKDNMKDIFVTSREKFQNMFH